MISDWPRVFLDLGDWPTDISISSSSLREGKVMGMASLSSDLIFLL